MVTGQPLDGAILHTVYGAFCGGYGILLPTDAVCAAEGVDHAVLLDRLATSYGVEPTTSSALIGRPVLRMATPRRVR